MKETVKDQVLYTLLDGDKRYSELMVMLGKPNRTIFVNLQELIARGLVSKPARGTYAITKKGEAFAEEFVVQKQAVVDLILEKDLARSKKGLGDELVRRLRRHGAGLDIQKRRTVKQIIASIGMLGYKDLAKAFLFPGKLEKEYIGFLANLYMHSVKKYLNKKEGELNYLELKAAWQAVGPDAWHLLDEREGLIFDFQDAWNCFAKRRSDELKTKMDGQELNQNNVFKVLRVFSFPVFTRTKLVKEGRI